ncbi:MAG: NAD-dependent dehydratase, partial [Anaerolineae bacterium]|nr:NAD-dependent dehydratase [Anaerolineae bacterium]
QIVNRGTGESNTSASIAQRIIARVGRPLKIAANRADRMRPDASEVLRLQSDNRLANELFGWTPEVSLDEGLDRTIAWVRDHLSLFEPESYTV